MIFGIGVFHVAVNRKCTEELSALALDFKLAAGFYGDVPAVRLIDKGFEGNDEIVLRLFFAEAVVVIVDCDKAAAEKRKGLFDVLTGVQIVSAETGKVFDHNAVGLAGFHVRHHLLKVGSLKGGFGKPAIYPNRVFP